VHDIMHSIGMRKATVHCQPCHSGALQCTVRLTPQM